jgi:hypothetical protein
MNGARTARTVLPEVENDVARIVSEEIIVLFDDMALPGRILKLRLSFSGASAIHGFRIIHTDCRRELAIPHIGMTAPFGKK